MLTVRARAYVDQITPAVGRVIGHSLLFGLAVNIGDLLFNFYLVSLGYAADTAGLFWMVNRLAGMLVGIPVGLLIGRLGAQRGVVIGAAGFGLGWAILLNMRALWSMLAAQFLVGAAFILVMSSVTPLLAQVTDDRNRSSMFGLNASATTMIGLLGSTVGGLLPGVAGMVLAVDAQATGAYRLALAIVVVLGLGAVVPLLRSLPAAATNERGDPVLEPTAPRLPLLRLWRFALPGLFLGSGAGMLLPFLNLFLRQQHGMSDAAVGLALGIVMLGMGLGALIGPPVTRRTGLRRGSAFLRMGAAPSMLLLLTPFWFLSVLGLALRGLFIAASFPMNDALIMRATPLRQRGLVMSLTTMHWAGGWGLSSMLSGWLQVTFGFTPVILLAALAFGISSILIFTLRIEE
jgi:MFS family permease